MSMKEEGAYKDCVEVLKWGFISRICLFLFQVVSNNAIPDHTGSMEDVFMKGYRHPPHHPLVEATLGGFDNWDSEHFVFIAENGYEVHQQTMAFFPLFPLLLWSLSHSVLYPLLLFLPTRSVLLIAGFVINFMLFPFAVVFLYLLTQEVSKDRHISLLAAALFCINPASVFMSALYTECIFALFTFAGLLSLEKGNSWVASVLFMLATATRSNGIVLCGYIGYHCLHYIFKILNEHMSLASMKKSFFTLIRAGLQCVLIVLPFALFQYYGYQLYCTRSSTLQDQASLPEWCSWRLPLAYSYIQEHYWNNGFLRYFQLKQIPNFALAAPMIILSACCVVSYFKGSVTKLKTEGEKEVCKSDRLKDLQAFNGDLQLLVLLQVVNKTILESVASTQFFVSEHMRPHTFHLAFLLVFATFFMNVQVITRFICSASPLLYWYSASLLLPVVNKSHKHPSQNPLDPRLHSVTQIVGELLKLVFSQNGVTSSKLVLGYFVLFVVLGFILHCNFFPWT